MSEAVHLRAPTATDEPAWRALWDAYCRFYGAALPEATTAETWARIVAPDWPLDCLLATIRGEAVGFAVFVLHLHTWSPDLVCYLEDLYVAPPARGRGVGRALIERLIDLGRASRWARVYWMTHADNARARALYDRFAAADGYVRYTVALGDSPTGASAGSRTLHSRGR